MKTLIKEIVKTDSEGVSFTLTQKASMRNPGFATKHWYVSWDKIGKALFGEQYSDTEERESNVVADMVLSKEGKIRCN